MIYYVLPVFALIVTVAGFTEIRHLELNDAHLIDTSPSNYAVASPTFSHNNWRVVSVNGNEFSAITPTCQAVTKGLNALSDAEKTTLQSARSQLESINGLKSQQSINGQLRYKSSRYSQDGHQISTSSLNNNNQALYQNDGYSIASSDENNFTIAKPGMINNIARIFVNGDLLTIIYNDGSVKMKPLACSSPEEQQLVQQSRFLLQQAEQQFKQSMQNLEQNMQRMKQNMQNIFGNGFPFNRGSMVNQNNVAMNQQPIQQQQQQQQQQFQQQQFYPTLTGMPGNVMNGFASANAPYNIFNPFASNIMRPYAQPFGQQFPFGNVNSPFGF